jgi:hypothetical protein
MKTLALLLCLLAAFSTPLRATSYGPPQKETIHSASGAHELVVDPKADRLTVRRSSTRLPLWSVPSEVWHHSYFVSNDGRRAFCVKWEYCQVDELNSAAVEVYLEGRLERTFSYSLLSKPRLYALGEIGPIGSFWRVWTDKVWQEGDRIFIQTPGAKIKCIDMSTGLLVPAKPAK